MGISGSHAATLNVLLGGRSSQRRFEGLHHLAALVECTCCRCTGEQAGDIPSSLCPVVAPVLREACIWCPQVTLDFWLSEQTAAGQQGVKLSAHLLIRLEESCGADQHTGLGYVLLISSFLSHSQQVLSHSTQRECVEL